jgi:hypothetical protein
VSTARAEAPAALVDGLRRLEDAAELDGAVAALDRVGAAIVPPGVVRDALVGRWLGHAVHPLLTDLPIGFWTSASVLDLLGGRRARPACICSISTPKSSWRRPEQRRRWLRTAYEAGQARAARELAYAARLIAEGSNLLDEATRARGASRL